VRLCSLQDRTSVLILLRASSMLIAGWKELNNVPPLSRAPRWRKVNPKKLNSVCSCDPRRFLSLQHTIRVLSGCIRKPDVFHPRSDSRQHVSCLGFADAVHHRESRRGKSHPPPLAEPCGSLSAYTAPIASQQVEAESPVGEQAWKASGDSGQEQPCSFLASA